MTTQDESKTGLSDPMPDLDQTHEFLQSLAIRAHRATRNPDNDPRELRILIQEISRLRRQVRSQPAADLNRWLENLQGRVEALRPADGSVPDNARQPNTPTLA